MPEPLPTYIPYSPPGAHIYPKAFYSVPEAASLLGMTPRSLRTMLKDGLVRALCIHNAHRYRYRIPAAEIVRLLTPLRPRGN